MTTTTTLVPCAVRPAYERVACQRPHEEAYSGMPHERPRRVRALRAAIVDLRG